MPLSQEIASYSLIYLFIAISIFHGLVIFKIIPADIVWGGRLKTDKQLLVMELVALLLNFFFLILMLGYTGEIALEIPPKWYKVILWFMFGLFTLNTLGNLQAKNKLERLIFTPLTLLLAILLLIVLLS